MILDVDNLYFKWLMAFFGEDAAGDALERLCHMLDQNVFQREVGNDSNRTSDGLNLRRRFLDDYAELDIDPRVSNSFLELGCSWLEMLIALSERLDYLYDGGIRERFMELVTNLGLLKILFTSDEQSRMPVYNEVDQERVDMATNRVDSNLIDINGRGGLFPLEGSNHSDQREVEIWAQVAAYFSERLEGVAWTSTN